MLFHAIQVKRHTLISDSANYHKPGEGRVTGWHDVVILMLPLHFYLSVGLSIYIM